jgi:general secretion pathway protein J
MTRRGRGRSRDDRGLTLLEVVLALSILAAISVGLAGALRVGLRAWEAGERRAALDQEVRVVVDLLTEVLGAAYPYRSRLGREPERGLVFEGEAAEARFVSSAPPLALEPAGLAFHAVRLGRDDDDRLRVVERVVPTDEPFGEGTEVILSRAVTGFRLQYRTAAGEWVERWDARAAAGLPAAVRVELSLRVGDRAQTVPPFVVPLALGRTTP